MLLGVPRSYYGVKHVTRDFQVVTTGANMLLGLPEILKVSKMVL